MKQIFHSLTMLVRVFHVTPLRSLFPAFLRWRLRHVPDRQFILFLSFVVGFCTALAAYLLKTLIHWIQHVLTLHFYADSANWPYLVYPVIGIIATWFFVRYVVRDDISHGVTKVLSSIVGRRGRIRRHNIWSSVCASSMTIGFGGSVGAEAPIVMTGSAIGSNLGSLFRMDHKTLMLLIGCGAAGAISGIFKAPIAGLCFTLEVLMLDLTMASLLPLLVTSVTAAVFAYIFTGVEPMFMFNVEHAFVVERVPYVIVLGVLCGLLSLYVTRSMNWFEGIFGRLKHQWQKFLLGGSVLSVLIFLFPSLYGEGYDTISLIFDGSSSHDWDMVLNNSLFYGIRTHLPLYFFLVLLTKVFATSATNGGGGCGGIFAPSLFLGCIAGFLFSNFANSLGMPAYLPEKNFALIGMAGMMSGVMHAPLMGIFLAIELTGGYDLFVPLMICSITAYLTIMVFEPHSIYSMRLAKNGQLLTHNKDKAMLLLMDVEKVLERDEHLLRRDTNLREIVNLISRVPRRMFAVVNDQQCLIGIVRVADLRTVMFRPELYHLYTATRFMRSTPHVLHLGSTMQEVMHAFEQSKEEELPVTDKDGIFVGFVAKSRMLETYRSLLVHYSEE